VVKAVQERPRRESTKYLIDLWQLQLVLLGVVGDVLRLAKKTLLTGKITN
jgi:hypothetical protein